MTPKVFISYSWTSQEHQELVRQWAERLVSDGVDVVLDLYDLKEGNDKYAFMERMVTDPQVTHVLVLCDKAYSEKADARKDGVGAESQIISKEVYEKVEQSKFIPIVTEFSENGMAFLPAYLASRIWIDFSSPEEVNNNWERLVRLIFGKPLHEKPKLGKPPAYIFEDTGAPSSPAIAKFSTLRQAILLGKKGVSLYRRDFLDACIAYADSLRVRERPDEANLGAKIVEDCGKLVRVRDHIVDWILLEAEANSSPEFSEAPIDLLERLRELKLRPAELNVWHHSWFEAHSIFVYEMFLYIVAALLKTRAYDDLHNIFSSHYLLLASAHNGERRFERFNTFYAYSETLNAVLAPEGRRLYSPAAHLLKRQAQRKDLPFSDIIQADLLVLLMSFITPDTDWYPQTLHYAGYADAFPFFIRATQHKYYKKLSIITGFENADELRQAVKKGHVRLGVDRWSNFHYERDFWKDMNMDKLDTIK